MRRAPIRIACGLLVFAAAAAASVPAGWAATGRPHPLFGNSILGNSAEIVTLWPTRTAGVDSLRITDFNGSALVPKAPGALIGGPASYKYEQLDVAAGDLDGDGRDDVVAAYSQPTADPWVHDVALVVPDIDAATLAWTPGYAQVIGTTEMVPNSYRSQGNVRLVTGNFDADGPQEFVVVTRVDEAIVIRLMELDAERTPVTLAVAVGPAQTDDLKESARFDVAAGDYDGDGIDEISLGGVRKRTDNGDLEVFVSIYAYAGGVLVEKVTDAYGSYAQGDLTLGQGLYIDHVAIATGHLRPDVLTDQILFSWNTRVGTWYEHVLGCSIIDSEWEFYVQTVGHLATLVVNASAWTISGWITDRKDKTLFEQVQNTCDARYDPGWTSPSLGVAVGDLTGDGIDEVAWATLNRVYLYQLSGSTLSERTSVIRWGPGAVGPRDVVQSIMYWDPSCRVVAIADLDAAADAPEWRAELIVQDWGTSSDYRQRIRVYKVVTDAAGVITAPAFQTALLEPQVLVTHGDVAMVCGDFDGDGVRLGEPTEHAITNAIHPSVILGAPPVHFDVFDGIPYDITGCYPGDGSYACTDFKSEYRVDTSIEFAVETEINADWGLSTTLKGSAEGFGAKVEASFGATYGQGFSRTGMTGHTYGASNTVSTSGGDRILADVLNYTLWEYPVYGANHQVLGHVSVIEPGSMVPVTQWFTFDSWASLSGSDAPAITHEPGNILSYAKAIPATGEYGDSWKADAVGWEVGTIGAPPRIMADYAFDMVWSDISGSSFTKSWNAGFEVGASISYEAGDPLGTVKAGVSAEVTGTYDMSEMSTHTVTVGQDIHLGATMGNLGGGWQAPYFVYPYVYRSSTTGTLVLDYRVQPGGAGTWWDVYRGAPDLTFIMPRFHREAKGIPLQDPTTRDRSPDVRVYPGTAAVGDTVLIRAIVRNFSLADHAGPVSVRFFAADPGGPEFLLQDPQGRSEFEVAGPIPMREGRPVTMEWVVPSSTPDTVRIYAEVDPANAVVEVHENNNRGYVEFYAVGGSVDVPAQPAVGVPFRLEPSVPNPFRGSTSIAFGLPEKTWVALKVYDIAGRLVATIVNEELAAGRHQYRWDGRGPDGSAVRPGVYLCRIDTGAFVETRRLVRLD